MTTTTDDLQLNTYLAQHQDPESAMALRDEVWPQVLDECDRGIGLRPYVVFRMVECLLLRLERDPWATVFAEIAVHWMTGDEVRAARRVALAVAEDRLVQRMEDFTAELAAANEELRIFINDVIFPRMNGIEPIGPED